MPVRRPVLALTLFLTLAFAGAARAAGPPDPVGIGSGWQLSFDGGVSWRPTTVPGVFDANTPASEFAGRVGVYRVTFTGPTTPAGYAWALRFESVRRVADVYLNGVLVGRHTDPYVPFELPATGLRPGAPNELEVRVDNRKGGEPREGWWNWGGIVRPVTLMPQGRVTLSDPAVLTRSLGRRSASMLFDGWVRNRSTTTLAPRLRIALRPPGGGAPIVVGHDAGSLAPGAQRRVRFGFTLPHPRLWAPGHPRLYTETVDTMVGGRVEQRDTRAVGVRTVRVVGDQLELNGRAVQLRGASIIEDVQGHGAALTDADMDAIVAKLVAIHANVTRSHFLLNERLLDRLDRAGILVWSQAPIYHRDRLLVTPAQRATALSTLRGTVLNARWHPSVLTHSVANELSKVPDTVPGTRAYLDAARRLVADLDPTIPPSVDMLSYPGFPRAQAYAQYPLLGINSYFGWYPGKAAHPVGNLAGLGPYLQRMHHLYPTSAQVVTEFGAEATMNGPANHKQTYAFQADYVKRNLQIIAGVPSVSGAIYWTLQEFAVKPFWDGGANLRSIRTDSIHNKGLISYGGFVKPAWHVAEQEFAATPLYRPAAGPQRPADPLGWILVILAPLAILALLALSAWALLDVWRLTRPPEAQVLSMPRRRAA